MRELCKGEYERWLANELPAELRQELESIHADEAAVEDRFYRDLEFGTGGLRGVLGSGSNRMNIYTIGKATQGLANDLNRAGEKEKRVAIAYDSRINSQLFAEYAARVLASNGIHAYIYPRLEPTPALSWAVRYLGCDAGICVTASHNPAKYNGYKVYGADGCQITVEAAERIQTAINGVDIFADVRVLPAEELSKTGLLTTIAEQALDDFLAAVYDQRIVDEAIDEDLKIVYTPLNGAGRECVTRILERIGCKNVTVVPEQEWPDGNFPTCPYPNPEIREALQKGLDLCEEIKPDLLLATDPDCDRVGVAVAHGGEYHLLTGNEMGILLLDYICKRRLECGKMPAAPVAVTTIVSTDMADPLCRKYGVELRRTLTGFKFIGEQIGMLEADGEADRYIFGFEESYGYLPGGFVRDKDAVSASMLICQMASYYKRQGRNLIEVIDSLYAEFGCFKNDLLSFAFEGADGMAKMQSIMNSLRSDAPAEIGGFGVTETVDYAPGVCGLPKADVLEFRLGACGKLLIRPSGTEPKIKLYCSVKGSGRAEADRLCAELANGAKALLESRS